MTIKSLKAITHEAVAVLLLALSAFAAVVAVDSVILGQRECLRSSDVEACGVSNAFMSGQGIVLLLGALALAGIGLALLMTTNEALRVASREVSSPTEA